MKEKETKRSGKHELVKWEIHVLSMLDKGEGHISREAVLRKSPTIKDNDGGEEG